MEINGIKLEKGKIYKIFHNDVVSGHAYASFTALTNCIIFSPKEDICLMENYINRILCDFIFTFDNLICKNDITSYDSRYMRNEFGQLNRSDIERIVEICKEHNEYQMLSYILLQTNYRYNRKLNKIYEITQG